ncbi:FxLYD domain-containing protein [Schinkia sp. CFF1]
MYCYSCGSEVVEEALFCSKCGTKLQPTAEKDLTEENASISLNNKKKDESINSSNITNESKNQSSTSQNGRFKGEKLKLWVLPLVSIIIVIICNGFFYFYEKNMNEKVSSLNAKAEKSAINGKYMESKAELQKAIKLRPQSKELQQNYKTIELAINLTKELDHSSTLIKEKNFDQASKLLKNVQSSLNGTDKLTIFRPLENIVKEKETNLTVAKVRNELNKLTTVEELNQKLTTVSTIDAKEASVVKEQIKQKIVQIGYKNAEEQLKKKQFDKALGTVDQAITIVGKHEKLVTFKDRINQEQAAFEKAEQERIEQAMVLAAEEDIKNKTAAVSVENYDYYLNEYGDLNISGTIKNVATKPISSITIYYSVYDNTGNFLGDFSTPVYPYYLESGESGSFEDVVSYVYVDSEVRIDHATWYLN